VWSMKVMSIVDVDEMTFDLAANWQGRPPGWIC
jgi:hypothetical protein